tara:strand:+ start:520 stop:669 length:150 start_codon:yes stop_codon:yes gene_type:complete
MAQYMGICTYTDILISWVGGWRLAVGGWRKIAQHFESFCIGKMALNRAN